ncbi:DUF2291 domain-containing protein [Autumnicola psychrophila]|uniref:DUF2291 domain-containing protein n=1 Tax=Autumnicola psychrophila TaxID=3075592 RepID=A0ABU3DU40_9FLAO|nr:DUF2291 domain-containing protein [Zunongwangia sp. F225]MDT0687232.1 DUF2291 domain-containing protein [Zunongwangia sp. F225]
MRLKKIKKILIATFILIAFISSISVQNLDEVKARAAHSEFDAASYAQEFWENKLIPNLSETMEINRLLELLREDPEKAFADHSKALGIGNIRYFMIKGEGQVAHIGENNITVVIHSDSSEKNIKIATEYIFGNAVRDASGKIDLQEFEQTMDFNMVSAEINKLVRQNVLPTLKEGAEVGNKLYFVGAMELNREQVNLENTEIIPVFVEFQQYKRKPSDEG